MSQDVDRDAPWGGADDDLLAPGSVLGGYEIEELAGRGGMGVVYRASEPRLGRAVALKIIASTVARDDGFRRRFIRESRMAARIEHPNVLPVYRAGEDDGRLYLAMRYVDGTDLGSLLRQGALSAADTVRIVAEIARALDAAHALGLVHRDLKPANVLLGGDDAGPVYLADFGLTVEAPAAGDLTATGHWLGTPAYVAPEQIRGARVDARTDVYALGAVVFHCLTGSVPFETASGADALAAHLMAPPPRPSARIAGLPEGVDDVVARAMSKDPADRYASAGELARAVEAAVDEPRERSLLTAPGPPPVTVPAAPGTHLPRPGTTLIGREADVRAVLDLLRGEGRRLVTLTGPGGTGKTRLAIEAAARLERALPGGSWFVSLAALGDSGRLTATVAAALGADEEGGEEALFERFREPALLVLDNLEQLDGAGEFVGRLLAACPDLAILATSRAPLRLRLECQLPVPPLRVSGGDSSPAVELFIERSRAVRPDFAPTPRSAEVIAEICARLDGLPLAIELAAARTSVLSPEALLERLARRLDLLVRGPADLPDRQRTLATTIAWSEELLSGAERQAFLRLSVFPGSWSLGGAEAVIGSTGPLDALEALESLRDKSLVVALTDDHGGEPRFTMLETVREYAGARRDDSDQTDEAFALMAAYHVELARAAFTHLHGRDQSAWVNRLIPELDNVRASMSWARGAGRDDVLLGIAASLWYFFELRGSVTEARAWLGEALGASGQPSSDRTLALCGACSLAAVQGDIGATASESAELEATLASVNDRLARVRALMALGMVAADRDDLEAARRNFADAAALARGHADHLAANSLNDLGDAFMRERRLDEACPALAEALRISERSGNAHGAAMAALNLAIVQLARGDAPGAERRLVEVLDIESHHDAVIETSVVQGLGWCAVAGGCLRRGAVLLACADTAWRKLATRLTGLEAEIDARARQTLESSLAADRLAALREEGSALRPLEALEWALERAV